MGGQADTKTVRMKAGKVKQALALPPDRAEKIDQLAKELEAEGMAAWRKKALAYLLLLEEEQRKQMMKGRRPYIPRAKKDLEAQERSWTAGLEKLLSPEELQQINTAESDSRVRRSRALAQMLIAVLDEKVAFTSAQREKLQSSAERLTAQDKSFHPEVDVQYVQFDQNTFIVAAGELSDADLSAVVDPQQAKRWRAAVEIAKIERVEKRSLKPKGDSSKKTARVPAPEEFERAVSAFLYSKAWKRGES
jgi:hypothetical protein